MVSKKDMIAYICQNVRRMYLMNSWNELWTFGKNVKVHSLPLTSEQRNVAYDIVFIQEFEDAINRIIRDWELEHPDLKAGFNGRSGGWLVLYKNRETVGASQYYHSEEDLQEMTASEVKPVYQDVKAFMGLYQSCLDCLKYYCDNYNVVEKTINMPKKVMVLEER